MSATASIRLVRCFDQEDLVETLEDLQGQGMRCQAYRSGWLLSQPKEKGKIWVHVLLFLWSWGLFNLVYLHVLSKRNRAKQQVYVRLASGVATKT